MKIAGRKSLMLRRETHVHMHRHTQNGKHKNLMLRRARRHSQRTQEAEKNVNMLVKGDL